LTLLTTINLGALTKLALLDLTLGANNSALIVPTFLSIPRALRRHAVLLGTLGAFAARAAMLALASLLVGLPGVDLTAGAYLLFSGYRLLLTHDTNGRPTQPHLGLWAAAGAVTLADMAMSIDNVLAVAAAARTLASHSTGYAICAVAFTIPVIMFGSGMLARFVHQHPVMALAGAALLGYLGADMAISDPLVAKYVTWKTVSFLGYSLPCSVLGALAVVQAALLARRRAAGRH
jgi:YjbE family integral membrane protein